ncbi:hypothetical protein [Chondrinema litorale]|uniref:hypothetical protein n=1 Tax=Chondrinema litorale TaxID=2994555 RepID=UPI00254277C9|nr:hypothetical protein [Chondrinema litorale]UZR99491.1 hypothetical protein OQ292_36480 [Chondrinema litorale]
MLLLIIIICSCKKNTDLNDNNILTPPLNISINDLVNKGFKKIDSLNTISKSIKIEGGGIIEYDFIDDHIFNRSICLLNIDSIQAVNWIENNNGAIVSNWEKTGKRKYKFFVKDRYSGLINEAVFIRNNLVIYFDYPDSEQGELQKYRTIDKEGKVTIKWIKSFGEIVTIKPIP